MNKSWYARRSFNFVLRDSALLYKGVYKLLDLKRRTINRNWKPFLLSSHAARLMFIDKRRVVCVRVLNGYFSFLNFSRLNFRTNTLCFAFRQNFILKSFRNYYFFFNFNLYLEKKSLHYSSYSENLFKHYNSFNIINIEKLSILHFF